MVTHLLRFFLCSSLLSLWCSTPLLYASEFQLGTGERISTRLDDRAILELEAHSWTLVEISGPLELKPAPLDPGIARLEDALHAASNIHHSRPVVPSDERILAFGAEYGPLMLRIAGELVLRDGLVLQSPFPIFILADRLVVEGNGGLRSGEAVYLDLDAIVRVPGSVQRPGERSEPQAVTYTCTVTANGGSGAGGLAGSANTGTVSSGAPGTAAKCQTWGDTCAGAGGTGSSGAVGSPGGAGAGGSVALTYKP